MKIKPTYEELEKHIVILKEQYEEDLKHKDKQYHELFTSMAEMFASRQ